MENLECKVSYTRLVKIANEFTECIFNGAETQFIRKLVSEMTANETWQDVTGIESGKPDKLLDTATVSGLSMYSTFKAPFSFTVGIKDIITQTRYEWNGD